MDPDSIEKTIDKAKAHRVRVSVICLVAEVHVCKIICEQTGGQCSVALDALHFQELMRLHTSPAPELAGLAQTSAEFIYMGFPKKTLENVPLFGFEGKKVVQHSASYVCPRCYTRAAEIPTQCCTCTLQLNSSTHIARSHHHLFPVPNFEELSVSVGAGGSTGTGAGVGAGTGTGVGGDAMADDAEAVVVGSPSTGKRARSAATIAPRLCFGCSILMKSGSLAARCPQCAGVFCVECDIYIHEALHTCPGCG